MTEQECLQKMIPPSQHRPNKMGNLGGVIQIWVTRACDKSCFGCTQGSNLAGKTEPMTVENFEKAIISLKDYFGVVGMFGGNPALHPHFIELCDIVAQHIPKHRRGIWCNNPISFAKAAYMRQVFNPAVSNLNVHLDQKAYDLFKQGWPECHPVGLTTDSRHSPPFVAMKDVLRKKCDWKSSPLGVEHCDNGTIVHERDSSNERPCNACNGTGQVYDEERAYEHISQCDINQHWSAMIGQFRGEVRAWFCEIAGAQAMLHQHEPDYPDTGMPLECDWGAWWKQPMSYFREQVRKHCHECGVPLRGYGELAQADDRDYFQTPEIHKPPTEQVSATHANVYKPKRPQRRVEVVTTLEQLGTGRLGNMTRYLQNAEK